MSMGRCGLCISAIMIILLVTGAAPATARPWTRPSLLARTGPGFSIHEQPSLAADSRGDVVAVWVRGRGRGPDCCDHDRVLAAYRPAGGGFGAPQVVSPFGVQVAAPVVGIDDAGNVTLVMDSVDPVTNNGEIEVAYRPHSGRFRHTQRIALGSQRWAPLALSVPAVGQSVIAWYDGSRIVASIGAPAGRFQAPIPISDINHPIMGDFESRAFPHGVTLTASSDRAGDVAVGWDRADGTSESCCEVVEAAYRPSGGDFGAPLRLSEGQLAVDDVEAPDLAFDPGGGLDAIWGEGRQQGALSCCAALMSRYARHPPTFEAINALPLPQEPALGPLAFGEKGVVLDAQDRLTVLLYSLTAGDGDDSEVSHFQAWAATGTAAYGFASTPKLADSVLDSVMTIRPDGTAVALLERAHGEDCYKECSATRIRIHATVAQPGGSFGSELTISGLGSWGPSLASAGNAVVGTWVDHDQPIVAGMGAAPAPKHLATGTGPVLSHLVVTPGRRTILSFRLSERARVAVYVTRYPDAEVEEGRLLLRVNGRRGLNRLRLPHRIAGRPLHRGTYHVEPLAEDRRGNDSRRVRAVSFRIR